VVSYTKSYAIGDELGTITIPVLGLSWPIFQGTGEEQLALGVGHYVGSVLPGLQDNTILSGHRTSVFNRIGELEVNDLILIQTEPGIFTYQVRGSRVVDRDDQTVIGPNPTAVLTLTTCYPFNSLTRTTQAFLVEADLIRTVLVE
jgi:sortase A